MNMKIKRISLILLTVLLMMLMGCGKKTKVLEETGESTTATVEAAGEEAAQVEEIDEAETTETNNEELTPVIYEGIDMESTLPGREWVETTFPGVIDTPKLVIYNDETNRKTIVEEDQIVSYNEADTFAVYLPDGVSIMSNSATVAKTQQQGNVVKIEFDMEYLKEDERTWKKKAGGSKFRLVLNNNGNEEIISCIISLGD